MSYRDILLQEKDSAVVYVGVVTEVYGFSDGISTVPETYFVQVFGKKDFTVEAVCAIPGVSPNIGRKVLVVKTTDDFWAIVGIFPHTAPVEASNIERRPSEGGILLEQAYTGAALGLDNDGTAELTGSIPDGGKVSIKLGGFSSEYTEDNPYSASSEEEASIFSIVYNMGKKLVYITRDFIIKTTTTGLKILSKWISFFAEQIILLVSKEVKIESELTSVESDVTRVLSPQLIEMYSTTYFALGPYVKLTQDDINIRVNDSSSIINADSILFINEYVDLTNKLHFSRVKIEKDTGDKTNIPIEISYNYNVVEGKSEISSKITLSKEDITVSNYNNSKFANKFILGREDILLQREDEKGNIKTNMKLNDEHIEMKVQSGYVEINKEDAIFFGENEKVAHGIKTKTHFDKMQKWTLKLAALGIPPLIDTYFDVPSETIKIKENISPI